MYKRNLSYLIVIVAILICSCNSSISVIKRHYRSGIYISLFDNNNKVFTERNKKIDTVIKFQKNEKLFSNEIKKNYDLIENFNEINNNVFTSSIEKEKPLSHKNKFLINKIS